MITIFLKKIYHRIRRSPSYSLSFFAHAVIITILMFTTYYVPKQANKRLEDSAILMLQKDWQKVNMLKFQSESQLDQYKEKDRMKVPPPEIKHLPRLPEVQFKQKPKIREQIDLLGVETLGSDFINPVSGQQLIQIDASDVSGSFSSHIKGLRHSGLDVVFVFDSTGSMQLILNQLKKKIENLSTALKKMVPVCRIGMVTYRDNGEDYLTLKHPLTHSAGSLKSFLRNIEAYGGRDKEEAVDEGLRVAIDELKWNKKAKKIIMLIGDAPPHKKNIPKLYKLIKRFNEKMNGALVALDTSPDDLFKLSLLDGKKVDQKKVLEEFRLLAEIGGGESARLIDEEKVIKKMVVLILGSQWEETIGEVIKQL